MSHRRPKNDKPDDIIELVHICTYHVGGERSFRKFVIEDGIEGVRVSKNLAVGDEFSFNLHVVVFASHLKLKGAKDVVAVYPVHRVQMSGLLSLKLTVGILEG